MSASHSPSQPRPKFRVAICGAGVGGLVLAITIGKYDPAIPIDLYEAHDSIYSAGVGISVWKKGHEVMTDLGLFDDFKEIFTHNPESARGPQIRRGDIREGGYSWFQRPHRHGPSSMHRQQMISILERHLPASCTVHSNKRLVNYVEANQDARSTSPIRLEFDDGTTAITDVLIGADGVRSAVRKTMFEAASTDIGNDGTDLKQYIDATFTGIFVYRALVPAEALRKEDPENIAFKELTVYVGKARYVVTYPIAKGTIINVVAMVFDPSLVGTHYGGRWVSDATRDELVGYMNGFEPNVRTLMKLCEKPSKWALHVVKPLPFCVRNRVALIGDACHAMTPHFGAGAGQAIDDAYILGRLIAHPLTPLSHIRDAFRIYEAIRFPFARTVASFSLSTGWMYALTAPGYYDGKRIGDDSDEHGIGSYEREGMETIKQEVMRRWEVLDTTRSAPEVWKEAELRLHASVASGNFVSSRL